LLQSLVRKRQAKLKRSRGADAETATGPDWAAAEAQGAARTATSRRRTVLRRNEALAIATPWRALRRGRHDQGGGPPEKVDQSTLTQLKEKERRHGKEVTDASSVMTDET